MPNSSERVTYLAQIADALVQHVDDGRIGVPRWLRWLDSFEDGRTIDECVATGLEVCNRVFGSKPTTEYRGGDGIHISVLANWDTGASALVSAVARNPLVTEGPEVMLLGSSGMLNFIRGDSGIYTALSVDR